MTESRMTAMEARLDRILEMASKSIADNDAFKGVMANHFELDKEAHEQVKQIHKDIQELKTGTNEVKTQVAYTNGKVRWHTKAIIALLVFAVVMLVNQPNTLEIIWKMLTIHPL